MAVFDYADMLATADELMDFFGASATLVLPGTKTGDAFNPSIGAAGSETCTYVEIDFEQREIDGTNVLATDKKVLIKAGDLSADLIPSATKITYGGVTRQIIGPVKQVNPTGTNLLWIAQVRT